MGPSLLSRRGQKPPESGSATKSCSVSPPALGRAQHGFSHSSEFPIPFPIPKPPQGPPGPCGMTWWPVAGLGMT